MNLVTSTLRAGILVALLGIAGPVAAQQQETPLVDQARALTQYALDTWDDRDGLPQNSVQAITQSREGYLWFGTQHGVARFNGTDFEVFDGNDSPALQRAYIWALEAARNGGVWIGSEEGGVVRYANGKFTAFTKANGLPSDWVTALKESSDGGLWIGMIGGGLAVLRNGALEVIDSTRGFRGKNVFALSHDTGGVTWVGYGGGLARVKNGRAEVIKVGDKPASAVALTARPGGGVFAAIVGQGVVEIRNNSTRVLATPATGLPAAAFRTLAVDDKGAVWAGTSGGLARIQQGKVSVFPAGTRNYSNIASMHVDNEGSLWLGLDGDGLARLRSTPIVPFGQPEGLASDMVLPIYEARNGDMWIGTSGGLNRIRNGKISLYTKESGHLTNNNVAAIAEARDGALWIGTFGGLSRIATDNATHFTMADGLVGPFIRAVHFDRTGAMWLGAHEGLQRFRPGPPRTYTTKDGLADDFIMTILEDRDGIMWVATRNGLSKFVNGRFQTFTQQHGLPDQGITALHQDAAGTMWIATMGGLARMKDGRIETFTSKDGLCSNELYSVLEDDDGRLWMGTIQGIMSVQKASIGAGRIACKMYGPGSGMRSRETNGATNPVAARTRDGRLWFATVRGVAIVDPDNLELGLATPPVEIENVVAQGRTYWQIPSRFPAGVRNLEIRFAGLSFVSPEEMRFRYKLEGFDDEWVDAGNRRVAYYTHLHPGRFNFRVQAANADGEWNEAGSSIAFTIAPLWWETSIFRAAVAAAVTAMLLLLYQLRMRSIRARQKKLVALVDERGRAEARYRELFENATDALFTADLSGRITAFNRQAELLTGYTQSDAVRLDIRELLPDSDARERTARQWLSGKADGQERVDIVTRNGDRVPVEVSTRTVLTDDGTVVGIEAVARDIRERAALEWQLRQSQKMEAVGQLAGGVAHDFNNLLTVIRGNGELLLSEMSEQDPARADLEQINIAADRASALTRQLLAFSRKQVIQPRPLDVNKLLREMEKMLQRLIGADFTLATLPSSEPAHVLADPGQLEQVLVNLVVNARDAMPNGGSIVITTGFMDVADVPQSPVRSTSGRAVVLTVADSGIGMDAETQARIFEPFFTTKEPGKGTGLGLSTVYGIVQQAGGQIVCSSQPGKGTTFKVYLPYSDAGQSDNAADGADDAMASGTETVLLVEDEDPVRTLAARILRDRGYVVIETRHGGDALAAAEEYAGEIHLLLSDMVMPTMNGRALADRLAQVRPNMRVLLMSGYTDDEIVRRGLLQPGVNYLQKPFTPQLLSRMVRQVLDA